MFVFIPSLQLVIFMLLLGAPLGIGILTRWAVVHLRPGYWFGYALPVLLPWATWIGTWYVAWVVLQINAPWTVLALAGGLSVLTSIGGCYAQRTSKE